MSIYFIIISIAILIVSGKLFASWGGEPLFPEDDQSKDEEGGEISMEDRLNRYQRVEDIESSHGCDICDEFSSDEIHGNYGTDNEDIDFDLHKAILYSEILRPKWKDFENR